MSSERILVVDDQPINVQLLKRKLERCGLAVSTANNGLEALEQVKLHKPDLILLDLRLPKVDGLEVLRRIKTDEALRAIPTVVLTTSAAELDVVEAYTRGAGSYLVKPVDFEKFTKLMEAFGFYWLAWNRFPH